MNTISDHYIMQGRGRRLDAPDRQPTSCSFEHIPDSFEQAIQWPSVKFLALVCGFGTRAVFVLEFFTILRANNVLLK